MLSRVHPRRRTFAHNGMVDACTESHDLSRFGCCPSLEKNPMRMTNWMRRIDFDGWTPIARRSRREEQRVLSFHSGGSRQPIDTSVAVISPRREVYFPPRTCSYVILFLSSGIILMLEKGERKRRESWQGELRLLRD